MPPHEQNGDMLYFFAGLFFFLMYDARKCCHHGHPKGGILPLSGTPEDLCASGNVIRAFCDSVVTILWTFNFGRTVRGLFL